MFWNGEPTLDEILSEPIVQLLMRRDGIDDRSIRRLQRCASLGLRLIWAERACPPRPPCRRRADGADR